VRPGKTILLALVLVGCSHTVYSPPARPLPLETAATLPPRDTGIQIEGGTHSTIFDPRLLSGTVRVRHGLEDDLEAAFEASVVHVDVDAPASGTSRNIHSIRAGLKYRVWKHFAVAGGFGGGYSAGGAFLSPDLGPIVAWENRYLVPFLSGRAGWSSPISPRTVDVSANDEPPRTWLSRPKPTWLLGVTTGLRVPLGWTVPEAGTLRGSLLAGVGFTHVADTRGQDTFLQGAVGGEIAF
jgi:hypothetical protein